MPGIDSVKDDATNITSTSLPYADEIAVMLKNTKLELAEALVVIVCCLVFALETLPGLSYSQDYALAVIEYAACITFAMVYALRWYATSFDPRHVLKGIELVDLLSFAPILSQPFSPDPNEALGSGFEVLRILRALRLQRFVQDEASFMPILTALSIRAEDRPAPGSRELRLGLNVARVVASISSLLFVSTGLIYEFEHLVNPQIGTYFDALYFGLTTLTTVGYGDIVPITLAGRLVVSGSIIAGVAIVPVQLAELGEAFLMSDRSTFNSALGKQDGADVMERSAPLQRQEVATTREPDSSNMVATVAPAAPHPAVSALDLGLSCGSCGESVHLRASTFCRICGGELVEWQGRVCSTDDATVQDEQHA